MELMVVEVARKHEERYDVSDDIARATASLGGAVLTASWHERGDLRSRAQHIVSTERDTGGAATPQGEAGC
jgi:hypothetical protein